MIISGTVSEITNIVGFGRSYPTVPAGTYRPLAGAMVRLAFVPDMIERIRTRFMTSGSFSDDTDGEGRFRIVAPESPWPAYLVVFERRGSVRVPNGAEIPIWAPVYRSATFRPGDAAERPLHLFTWSHRLLTPTISQSDVNELLGPARAEFDARALTARVASGRVACSVTDRSGHTVTFDVVLKPSTSSDPEQILRHTLEDLDAPLCADEDAISRKISGAMRSVLGDLGERVRAGLCEAGAAVTEAERLCERAALTVREVVYPVESTRRFGWYEARTYSIRLVLSVGFPLDPLSELTLAPA